MKRAIIAILTFLIFFFWGSESYPQNYLGGDYLKEKLSKIENIAIEYDKSFDRLKSFKDFDSKILKLFRVFFLRTGDFNLCFSDEEIKKINCLPTLKKNLYAGISLSYFQNTIYKIKISFRFFDEEFFLKKSTLIKVDENWHKRVTEELAEFPNQSYKIISYSKENRQNYLVSLDSIKKYADENPEEKLIGIYEKYGFTSNNSKYQIGIIKSNKSYKIIYLSGAANFLDWKEGELKGEIFETAMENFYSVKWIRGDKSVNSNVYLTISDNYFLNFEFFVDDLRFNSTYVKIYPEENSLNASNEYTATGSGFLINKEGCILTNYHVIEGGKKIELYQAGKKYNGTVLLTDKISDLALLKINKIVDAEPLAFSGKNVSMGEELTALGFPLIESMGESIKLAKGIVGSDKGFLDNPNYFQFNCEIFPGNSGGPVLDEMGTLKGIITSVHRKAGKVAYSLKEGVIKAFLERNGISYIKSRKKEKINLGKIFHSVFLIKVY